jgi:hypothetical protein
MSYTVKELLNEAIKGRIIPTHLKNGKPNPNHPHYEKHSAAYVAPINAARVQSPKPYEKVTAGHYSDALANVPDEDSSDAVQRIANKLKISYEDAHKGLSKQAGRDFHKEHADIVNDYTQSH